MLSSRLTKQTLSSLAQAQRFFKVEEKHQSVKLTPAEKCKVLERLEGKSSRECEKELLRLSSSPLEIARPERARLVDETHTELKLVLEERTLVKLKRIQALRSHAQPHPNYAELLDYMADEVLKRIDPVEKAKRAETRKTHSAPPTSAEVGPTPTSAVTRARTPTSAEVGPTPTSAVTRARAPIPAAVRREVWLRDGGRCGWQCADTGELCGSRHFLEYDHTIPVAWGGTNDATNLRLRCRAHNARSAVRIFGPEALQKRA
jgi:HNH endonuclease